MTTLSSAGVKLHPHGPSSARGRAAAQAGAAEAPWRGATEAPLKKRGKTWKLDEVGQIRSSHFLMN